MALKGLDFPPGMTLETAIKLLSQGGRGAVAAWLIEKFGDEAGDALTVENFIKLLSSFGFTGPLSNYLPPVCSAVLHSNIYILVAAGTTEKVGLPGCEIKGGTRKYRSIVATPLDTTARDLVVLTQRIRAAELYVSFFSNPSCGHRPGNFSTFENICVPCDGCVEFEWRNTDTMSDAHVHLEAESWVA